jgi:hypothetical protein
MPGGRQVVLPADYVRQHVELGYATTAHRAQGRTVDTAHAFVSVTTQREVLYVAATRGRECNRLYVDTMYDPDADTQHGLPAEREAGDVLRQVLEARGRTCLRPRRSPRTGPSSMESSGSGRSRSYRSRCRRVCTAILDLWFTDAFDALPSSEWCVIKPLLECCVELVLTYAQCEGCTPEEFMKSSWLISEGVRV